MRDHAGAGRVAPGQRQDARLGVGCIGVCVTRRDFCAAAAVALSPRETQVSGPWPLEKLSAALLPRERWRPYPPAADRARWQALPAEVRQFALAEGEAVAGKPYGDLPATLYLDFTRTGNRSRYEAVHFARRAQLAALAVAECVEGKGRFLDGVANGV
jgi:hypothetical protein